MYVSLPKPAKRDCLVRSLGFKAVFRDLVSGFRVSDQRIRGVGTGR